MPEGVESGFHVEPSVDSIATTFGLIVSGLERIHSLVSFSPEIVCLLTH